MEKEAKNLPQRPVAEANGLPVPLGAQAPDHAAEQGRDAAAPEPIIVFDQAEPQQSADEAKREARRAYMREWKRKWRAEHPIEAGIQSRISSRKSYHRRRQRETGS